MLFSPLCYLKHPKPLLSSIKDPQTLAKIHALFIITGSLSHPQSPGHLIAAYSRFNDISAARLVFETIPSPKVSAYNALIIAFSRHKLPARVLELYRRLVSVGLVRPDSSTLTLALKACSQLSDLKSGEEIRTHAADLGYRDDVFVCSSMVNLYAKCGRMEEALEVFEGMPERDLVLWTTMISRFVSVGKPVEAIDVYRKMRLDGVEGDEIVMIGLAKACAGLGDVKMGLSVHGRMIRLGMRVDVVVETSLVDMYAKNGMLELARVIFDRMKDRNVVSWSALISGYAQNGFAGYALAMLVEMQDSGLEPDSDALVSALLACSQIGFFNLGKSVHGFIVRRYELEQISGTALIDMYSKCGSLVSARAVFDRIISRDLISWNAIIGAYGVHGCGREALSLFLQMRETKIKPDDATFASLLSSLGHSGLVEEGRYWFGLMLMEFGIEPGEKHYNCMVDLLARAGHVEEAHDLINSMAFTPGITVWVALLAGCHNHKKFELGEFVAEKVIELDPDDLGIYALVSNTYAAARKWDKVAEVRRAMRNLRAKKVPGCSLVEVNGKFHGFLIEDKSHPEYGKTMEMLERLNGELKKFGYIPRIEFCVP